MSELERLAARHCAATLLGEKTGSMFMVGWDRFRCSHGSLRSMRETLSGRDVVVRVFRTRGGALIYIYRTRLLERDLGDVQARRILSQCGYDGDVLKCLQQRLLESPEFPHEIGLFLGYPAKDVAGFMENGGANYKLTGCWKVYHDVERAKHLFCTYKQYRQRMMNLLDSGLSFHEILCAS